MTIRVLIRDLYIVVTRITFPGRCFVGAEAPKMAPPAARLPSPGSSRWTDDPVLTPPPADGPLGRKDSAGSQVAGGDEDGSIHSFHMSETMNSTRGAAGGGVARQQALVSGSGVPADAASLLPAPRGTGKWTSSSPDTTLRGGMSRMGGPASAAAVSDGPDDDFWVNDANEDAIQVSQLGHVAGHIH